MIKNKKLIVIDFDNTIYLEDLDKTTFNLDEVSSTKENITVVNELVAKGYVVLISSGRSYESLKDMINSLNLNYSYLGCNNGCELYDKEDNLLYLKTMFKKDVETVKKISKQFMLDKFKLIYPKTNELNPDKVCAISITIKDEIVLNNLKTILTKKLKKSFLGVGKYKIRVLSKSIDKLNNVTYLQKQLSIKKEQILVLGDGVNDLKLFLKFQGLTFPWGEEVLQKNAFATIKNLTELNKFL